MRSVAIRPRLAIAAAALVCAAGAAPEAKSTAEPEPPQQRTLRETRTKAQKRTRKPRQVSGMVVDTKLVSIRGSDEKNLIVLLKTNEGDRRLLLDLGPSSKLSALDLGKGQNLAAEGVVVRIEDAQLLVADRVRQKDKTVGIARLAQIAQTKKAREDDNPYGEGAGGEANQAETPSHAPDKG